MTIAELITHIQNLGQSFWFDMIRKLKEILLAIVQRQDALETEVGEIQVDQDICVSINQVGTSEPAITLVKNSAENVHNLTGFSRTGVGETTFVTLSPLNKDRIKLNISDKLKFDGETTPTVFIYHVSEATINGLYQNTYKIKTNADGVLEDTILKATFYPINE